MPIISITFDRQAPTHALDYKVDSITVIGWVTDTYLCADVKPLFTDKVADVSLKLRVRLLLFLICGRATRIHHVTQKTMSHPIRAQHI